MSDSRLPITVITGFLGAGKTTLLNALLRQPAMARTAVIINEFGEIGIDHDLVEHAGEEVVELQGGCLCCTIRSDLGRAIRGLNLRRIKGTVPDFVRLVIETTGLADPAPILQTLMRDPIIEHDFRLDGVVTVVDARHGWDTLNRQIEAVKQAAVADRLLVTKTDLATEEAVGALEARLRALNPAASIERSRNGQVDATRLLDAGPWDATTKSEAVLRWMGEEAVASQHDHRHGDHADHRGQTESHTHDHAHEHLDRNRHDARIRAFCIRRAGALPSSAASLLLDLLTSRGGADLLRVKGILDIEETPGRPLVVHAVQHVVHAPVTLDRWPSDDHDSRLVVIARDLEPADIERWLDAAWPQVPNEPAAT